MTGSLHKHVFTFCTISRWILLRMRNVLDKNRGENQNTHFMSSNFFSENRAVCEIMSKNMVEKDGPQMTSQHGAYALHAGQARLHERMHTPKHARTRAYTHTHVIHIAFPR